MAASISGLLTLGNLGTGYVQALSSRLAAVQSQVKRVLRVIAPAANDRKPAPISPDYAAVVKGVR